MNRKVNDMENKEINVCLNIKKQLENLSQDQYILLFNMLNDKEKSSLERCFYYEIYVDKIHASCITPEVKEYINGLINNYYEDDRTEQIPIYDYITSNIKEIKHG